MYTTVATKSKQSYCSPGPIASPLNFIVAFGTVPGIWNNLVIEPTYIKHDIYI